ncbi:MAG: phenylacyl-CoA dehydrogenase [Myxococcaceae bacterium]|nr:phenylacyl-CoA dehydrogenase [Myxococcaceae bacterium]
MPTYKAPLRDFRFLLNDVFEATRQYEKWGFPDATPDIVDAVLAEGAKFAEGVLAPLNEKGDEHSAKWADGIVTTAPGFKEAWKQYREGEWGSIGANPEYGGQGLPESVELAFNEMACAACVSFRMSNSLTLGAVHAIEAHASDELKQTYLPKLISAQWSGTMCLTEPHAGSDVGIITTSAKPAGDGSFLLTGTKIFITFGDHDMTENIIHLVLARLPGAAKGPKGISLFLVPKFLLDEAQNPTGDLNGVVCSSIEHKMGIKASPTCVLNFEDAKGFLVGREHGGLAAMFTMMNYARLDVGQQGLSQGERALQGASAYALERLQMRAAGGVRAPDKAADPIIAHADIRRMLLTIKSLVEGSRALAIYAATQLDKKHHSDESERLRADDLLAFLIPIVKGFLTEVGSEAAYWGIQIWGGAGYIRESGMEKYARDARIMSIYEGTNTIQANDLLRRKVIGSKGALLQVFLKEVETLVSELTGSSELGYQAQALAELSSEWASLSTDIARRAESNADEAAGAAFDYLMYSGYVAVAYFWARMSKAAIASLGRVPSEDLFLRTKLQTARFYFERILPRTRTLAVTLKAPSKTLMDVADDAFSF